MTDCSAYGLDSSYVWFKTSRCLKVGNPRQFGIICQSPSTRQFAGGMGFCKDTEICFDDPGRGGLPRIAMCKSRSATGMLDESTHPGPVRQATGQVKNPSGCRHFNFAVVMTSPDDDHVLYQARAISLLPRDVNNNSLAPVLSCDDCNHLIFMNSLPNVENFDINITFPGPHDAARIHVYSLFGAT